MHRRLSVMLFALFHADEHPTASIAWEHVLVFGRFSLVLLKRTFAGVIEFAKAVVKGLSNHMIVSLMLFFASRLPNFRSQILKS